MGAGSRSPFADGGTLRLFDKRRLGRVRLDPGSQRPSGPTQERISVRSVPRPGRARYRPGQGPAAGSVGAGGVGNLLADQALWQARLHPRRRVDTLADDELRTLHRALRTATRAAVRHGGVHIPGHAAGVRASVRRRCARCAGYDRLAGMPAKVGEVTPFLVDSGGSKSWLFVKVETDDGLIGWGEVYTQADRDGAMLAHLNEMGRHLVGRNPFAIKHFASVMYLDYALRRPAMDFWSALSGLEQALWDIAGKACGQPVYNLLGGPCRERFACMPMAGPRARPTPDELARCASDVVARGFTALKFDPFTNPWRTHIGRVEEDLAVERVRAVREAVGNDVEILVEVHRRLAPNEAIRVAQRLEPFEPFWFEEPIDAEDMAGLAEVRSRISLPVVTGEALYSKSQFAEVFAQPRRGHPQSGCVQLRRHPGAEGDRRDGRAVARHRRAAQLQQHDRRPGQHAARLGVHPQFSHHRVLRQLRSHGPRDRAHAVRRQGQLIALPTAPGLGIELDEAALRRHPLQARRATPYPLVRRGALSEDHQRHRVPSARHALRVGVSAHRHRRGHPRPGPGLERPAQRARRGGGEPARPAPDRRRSDADRVHLAQAVRRASTRSARSGSSRR